LAETCAQVLNASTARARQGTHIVPIQVQIVAATRAQIARLQTTNATGSSKSYPPAH